ncbi:MAG TPA: DinB family protein [Alphaproteobacteria bacterium]|nr:DinB family protein [Alphaproteobacteria bacterium]
MDLLDHFRGMARNNAWSNYRLIEALKGLRPDELEAPRISFFPSLRLTLHHILIVDWYYIDAVEGGGRGRSVFRPVEDFPKLPDLARAQMESDQKLVRFCDRLTEPDLDRLVELKRERPVPPERVGHVLAHLFVHQIHHRGQVHAMLSGTSVAPPQLDEFFLVGDSPLNEAELTVLGLRREDWAA